MNILIPAATALLLFAACRAPLGKQKQEDTYASVEGAFELVVENRDVALRELEVRAARSSRPEGRLVVDLDLVNTASYRVPFEWRIYWFTEGGAEVDFQNPWRPTVIDVHESRHMTLTAPTPACKGWKLATRSRHTSN